MGLMYELRIEDLARSVKFDQSRSKFYLKQRIALLIHSLKGFEREEVLSSAYRGQAARNLLLLRSLKRVESQTSSYYSPQIAIGLPA